MAGSQPNGGQGQCAPSARYAAKARRGWARWLCAGAACAIAVASPAMAGKRPPPPRPNILLIVADDLGYTDTGPYGGEIPTPALDQIARQGTVFADFHAGMACSPTRAMMLTGVDAHKAGLGNMAEDLSPNQQGKSGYEGYLNTRVAALSEVLHAAGYRTYMAGKWHLGLTEETGPAARGFDFAFASLQGGAGHFANMLPIMGNGKAKYRDGTQLVTSLPADFYSSRSLADRLIGYIRDDRATRANRPFLAYLAFTAPHWPLQAPPETIARFKGKYDAGPDTLFAQRLAAAKARGLVSATATGDRPYPGWAHWDTLTPGQRQVEARRMEIYAAMVAEIDGAVGRVVAYLRQTHQLDNTVILFLSDNGAEGHDFDREWPELAAHARDCCDNRLANMGAATSYVWLGPDWARASTAPFRLFKGYSTEGGTRVPFMIRLPYGMDQRHDLATARGHVMDIMPTLLDLARVEAPQGKFEGRSVEPVTGRSMLPYIRGRSHTIHPAGEPFAQELFGKRSIRLGTMKAVWMPPPHGNGGWALYDLATDLSEQHDLAAIRPADLARLVARWDQWAKANNVIIPDWVSGY